MIKIIAYDRTCELVVNFFGGRRRYFHISTYTYYKITRHLKVGHLDFVQKILSNFIWEV